MWVTNSHFDKAKIANGNMIMTQSSLNRKFENDRVCLAQDRQIKWSSLQRFKIIFSSHAFLPLQFSLVLSGAGGREKMMVVLSQLL